MKKPLVVVGAVASAFVLGVAPSVVSGLGMSAYAAEVSNDSTQTNQVSDAELEQARALVKEIEGKYPDIEKWGTAWAVMYTLENQYGCSGLGCAADSLLRNNGENDIVANTLKSNGIDPTTMNTIERLEAVKKVSGYNDNAELKQIVEAIEDELPGTIYGFEGNNYNLVYNLPAQYVEQLKDLTPVEVIKATKAIPGYTEYSELGHLWSLLNSGVEGYGPVDIKTVYSQALSALAAADAFTESQKTPEQVATTNELKELVEKTKANPEYQKYEKLVRGVHEAEILLERLKQPVTVTPNARAISVQAEGGMGAVEDDTEGAEIAATIKALGDSMRTVGVTTTLGEGLTTATVDDLAKAIELARGVEKFEQYEELVEAIDLAEIAIANGVTDAAELKEVLANVRKIVDKVFPPDAGVAPIENTETSAVASFSTSAIVAGLATTIGAAVILKRRFSHKIN